MGYLILRGASRLDAFSVYPVQTWLPCHGPVSYTHLDVYKRQLLYSGRAVAEKDNSVSQIAGFLYIVGDEYDGTLFLFPDS